MQKRATRFIFPQFRSASPAGSSRQRLNSKPRNEGRARIGAAAFTLVLNPVVVIVTGVGVILILVVNVFVQRKTNLATALKFLPLFHVAMLVYTASIIASYFL